MRPRGSSTLYHPFDAILGSIALVRVSRELAIHGSALGISEIAARTKLSAPSVRGAVRRLVELDVASSIGVGRTLLCSLKTDQPLSQAIRELFQAERDQLDVLFQAMRDGARHAPPIVALWVYGSAARGADRPDSDIDVALVSQSSSPGVDAEVFREALSESAGERARRVSVIAFSASELRKIAGERSKFWRELERDAVVVWGDPPAAFVSVRKNRKARA